MEKGLVSAIILTHNRVALLRKAILSVQKQSYKNIEIIVIDNHSTQETAEYLDSQKDVKIIREKTFVNGNKARNDGLNAANGEFIALLDDDDEWLPNKIEQQVNVLNHSSEVGVVYSGVIKNYNHKYSIIELPSGYFVGNIYEKVFDGMFATSSTLMIRSNLLSENYAFDEKLNYWQDYDLLVCLSGKTNFFAIDEPLTIINVDTLSKSRLSNQFKKWQSTVDYFYLKHHERINALDKKHKKLMRMNYINDAITRLDRKKGVLLLRFKFLFQKVILNGEIQSMIYMFPFITLENIRYLKYRMKIKS